MSDKRKLTQEELKERLEVQLKLLETSADAFDAGKEEEALRMATAIRVIVHDTASSRSLLGQLNLKSKKFLDTGKVFEDEEPTNDGGFVSIDLINKKYVAPLDVASNNEQKWSDFDVWWGRTILKDSKRRILTRKKVILIMANQYGGSHVDSFVDEVFYDFTKNNPPGLAQYLFTGKKNLEGAVSAAVRQIAHEVLRTLKSEYSKLFKGVAVSGLSVSAKITTVSVLPSGSTKVGRNKKCSCGSGKKYKFCCGK